ncbi:nucleoside deaminase [Patescibacteria group bacterium]|nr:nucleoside deaminase [Patescibacteria group bacterium]
MEQKYIETVHRLARNAFDKKEIPVGAIVVDKSGQIIGRGYNLSHAKKDVVEHAEIRALKQAFKKTGDWRLDGCTLIVNLEPCLMCLGAIANARVGEVVYYLADPQFGSVESRFTKKQLAKLFPKLIINKETDTGETKGLLQSFFKKLRK